MSVSTHGIRLKGYSRWLRDLIELLSAMRFAISLLSVISIASIIGTVLKQQEPMSNYVNEFGPFWTVVFDKIGLFSVYSAWWFLLILFFLVVSTSLCVARNTPQILRDLRLYKEHLRVQSFQAFKHHAAWIANQSPAASIDTLQQKLKQLGWKFKTQERPGGTLIAAKAGDGHKLGYIAAHSAIVLICVGGLLDGDMLTRAQMWWQNKVIYTGGGMIADVPAASRLASSNPAFRANLFVSEGQTAGTAVLQQPTGVVLQDLPFSIELKKFNIEFYSTGMPKLFASDIVIHDKQSGDLIPARVEVNHPFTYKGVSIFQSSFDDGGSFVQLESVPLHTGDKPIHVDGTIGASTPLTNGKDQLTLEYAALRVMNVETLAKKDLRNVGPSITYKLRDAAGQAHEFQNYMLPVKFPDSNISVFLLGVRDTTADSLRYLRLPADSQDRLDSFIKLHEALQSEQATSTAIDQYLAKAVDPARPDMRGPLKISAERVLALFAGRAATGASGLEAVAAFLEKNVPEDQRAKTSEVLIRILNGVLYELAAPSVVGHVSDGLELRDRPDWLNASVLALSDIANYPAPMIFQLKDFRQVQASVFQVTKAPGQKVVYAGAVLLIVGVFLMLFIRERRLWIWLPKPAETSQAEQHQIQMAFASNRQTLATDLEFERIKKELAGEVVKQVVEPLRES